MAGEEAPGGPPAKLRRARAPGGAFCAEGEAPPAAPEEAPASPAPGPVAEALRSFLRADAGSLASLSTGGDGALERLSFQSSRMRSLLLRFPESLLLHRLQSPGGQLLCAFLVESKERQGKLVHVALLREDSAALARRMLRAFQDFNPEWCKVRVVFVDAAFPHQALLQAAFPSAQVLLSVYHTVRLLERRLEESRASPAFKKNLGVALREAVFATSSASLETLSRQVKRLVDRELHDYLQVNWFSCEMLWYMHAKKGLHSCSTYIDSLDLITQKLSSLFSTQQSLETSILRFVEHADSFNTKQGLEHLSQGFPGSEAGSHSSLIEEPRTQTRAASRRGLQQPPDRTTTEEPKQFTRHTPTRPVASMLAALEETCTDLAYQLCLNEWDVVQTSTQLVNSTRTKTTVQLLEEEHQVGKDGLSCSCSFRCRYQLPCRHILSVLQETRQVVDESMVGKRWQKKYQHLSVLRRENLPEGAEPCMGAVAAAAAPEERQDKIQSLSKELGNLLLQSEGEEREERISTLQMIVNIWTKCCELQEDQKKPLPVQNVGDLPFLWVKEEEIDMELADLTAGEDSQEKLTKPLHTP